MTSTLKRYASFTAHEKPTVGDSKISYIGSDHLGWMLCDGRELNVSDYYILWSVIGYSFGGSGAKFNLPAAAGRVPGVSGNGAGLTPRVAGDMVGTEKHTLTIAEMPAHNHGVAVGGQGPSNNTTSENGEHSHTHNANGAPGYGLMYQDGFNTMNASINDGNEPNLYQPIAALTINPNGNHAHTMNPAGNDEPHENMQPTIFMGNMFIYSGIPTLGVWPYTTGFKVK